MRKRGVQGIGLSGGEPKALLLSDGSRLALEDEGAPAGRSDWTLEDGEARAGVSVSDALSIAGEEHEEYIRTRTRAEIAWLRLAAEWFAEQAERLDRELAGARA